MALLVAAGRVGCLMAGCCYGRVCSPGLLTTSFPPGSIAFTDQLRTGLILPSATHSLPLYPVQAWEAAGSILLACICWAVAQRIRRDRAISGEAFLTLAIGYALLRFSLEFFRGDNPPIALGLTFSQLNCLAILAASILTALIRRRTFPLSLAATPV
jgi:phosphatidylglycerol:prolipoprotein diacylglycerol transferase